MHERVIAKIYTDKPIGCCGGHAFKLIAINGGYTTECVCGMWCGQWFNNTTQAVQYFNDMVSDYHKGDY